MKTSLRFLISILLCLNLYTLTATCEGKQRRGQRAPAKRNAQQDARRAEEQAALTELQLLITDEVDVLQKKLTHDQILNVIIVLEQLRRATYTYQVTGDMGRAASGFFKDGNAKQV